MERYLLYKGERTVRVSLLSVDIPFLPDCPLSFGLGGFLLAHLTLTAIIYHAVTSNALLMSMHIDCFQMLTTARASPAVVLHCLNFLPLKNTIRFTVVFIVTIATSQYCIHSGIT